MMFTIGFSDLYGSPQKALTYLLDRERQGEFDGWGLNKIGYCYGYNCGCDEDPETSMSYFQRSIDMGYTPAYLALHTLLWGGRHDLPADKDAAMLILLEAEKKGIGMKDDRILEKLIARLRADGYQPSARVLGTFQNQSQMALHYCDLLIQRKSPTGYQLKGVDARTFASRSHDDKLGLISLLEEADRVGLATSQTYSDLKAVYTYVY